MVLKLCYTGREYFTSYWNRFDFFVTWCSVVDLVLDFWGHDTDFLRALRVARILRLLRLNRKMRRFENTVAKVATWDDAKEFGIFHAALAQALERPPALLEAARHQARCWRRQWYCNCPETSWKKSWNFREL